MKKIVLSEVNIPDLGRPTIEPKIPAKEYEKRILLLRGAMRKKELDAVVVYGDREHCANIAFLCGYDPRFEEALLVICKDRLPALMVGNEGLGYAEAVVPIRVETFLVQCFSLMGQPRDKMKELSTFLREVGIKRGMRIGVAGWKYFTEEDFRNPTEALEIPSYMAESLRRVVGPVGFVRNANDLLTDPNVGLRSINSVDQIASFEFAATICSQSIHEMIAGLREGMTEFEAVELMKLNGMPLSCHLMLSSGKRARFGLCSPSSKVIKRGEPLTAAIGLRGSLACRAAYVVDREEELKKIQPNYLSEICIPYFGLIVKWYESIGIEVSSGQVYKTVQDYLRSVGMKLMLNPGHLIHLDEWLHSPFYEGSIYKLKSGMVIQADMILTVPRGKFGVNVEDTVSLADEHLQSQLRRRYPETFKRIERRRRFVADVLGIDLRPEVLPLSNDQAVLRPFLLKKNHVLICRG